MRYRKNNDIIDFFNVSIVLPFYKRLDDFKKVLLKNAHYFQRNGIEVVIVLDEPSEEHGLINFVTNFPFINFKIIINREAHPWRNPSKVINVGIKHASFDYILVMSPETELYTDVIYQLRYALYHYPSSYATGVVSFISHDDEVDKIQNVSWLPYGSIMVAKTDLLEVFGYNENHDAWGGEDDQIRRQLDLLGLTKIELPDAKNVHREKKSDGHKDRSSRINEMPIRHLKNIFYPKQADLNYKPWGQDFNEVIWCWNTHKDLSQLKEFMEMFPASSIMNNQICNYDFGIIALIQVRNESKNILEILPHLDKYCDGIILLDDGSTDDSYELAQNEKLLLKVQKEYKGYFDDLENRNALLRLASFIKSKWFFFIDADERFDNRYCDIRKYLNDENCDVYRFQLVDLWDNPETYRIDIPDRKANGIATRARMFRNKGSMQIYTNREIHFPTVPYSQNMRPIDILLLHYGNFDKKIRDRKYKLYKSQDPDEKKQAHSYEFLRDEKVILGNLKNIKLNDLHNKIKKKLSKKIKLIAVFSFRYDKELVPDLKKNLNPFVDDYVIWDDSKNTNEWYNEGKIRNYLIQEAKNKGADWILCVDPDERFEKNAAKKIREYIQTNKKYIYSFKLRELWDSPNKYRNDGIWGAKTKARLFPNLSGQNFMNLPVHSEWYPQNTDYKIIETDINLYHLKMINEQNREDRKNLYNKLDPNKEFQKIGYDYLTDTTNIELVTIEKDREYLPKYKGSYKIRQTI